MPDERASVPIPKFACASGTLGCELRNQRDTTNVMILVPLLNPKSQTDLPPDCANFGFAALEAGGRAACAIDAVAMRP